MNNSQNKSLDISRYLFCEPPIKLSLTDNVSNFCPWDSEVFRK